MPMDSQSTPDNSAASGLDDHFKQILLSIESALNSQVRISVDSHRGSTGEILSNFIEYLRQVEEAARTTYNPQADPGLVFDRGNLHSIQDPLQGFLGLGHSGLNPDYVGMVPLLHECCSKIEQILQSDAPDGPRVSRPPSPTSHPHDYACMGSWSHNQDEFDTANDDQAHDTDIAVDSASRFNDSISYYQYFYATSLSDVNEAHSSIAVHHSETSSEEDEH